MAAKRSQVRRSYTYEIMRDVAPSILVNIIFIIQALTLRWELGTMVWVYWLQGYIIVLLGYLPNWKNLGWAILLALMSFYGLFLASLTFPSDKVTYIKNNIEVAAEEFVVFNDVQWSIVLLNVLILLLGYLFVVFTKKDKTAFSGWQVAKRLIPLHLTILFAGIATWSVLAFLLLKSTFDILVDYLMTWIRHVYFGRYDPHKQRLSRRPPVRR